MNYSIKAKPTLYNNRLYRSRLEARWAAFFDLVNWKHEYEPIDFKYWSPDFLIYGYSGNKIYIEVKPYVNNEIITDYYERLQKSNLIPKKLDIEKYWKEKDIYMIISTINTLFDDRYIGNTILFGLRLYSELHFDHYVFKYPFDISSSSDNWDGLITKEGQEHSNRKYHIQTTNSTYHELISLWNLAANKVMFFNPIKNE